MFIIFLCSVIAFVTCTIIYVAVRSKISPWLLVKKGIPTLVIAITTASSAAAFGTNLSSCQKKFGIKNMVASFGVPLGMVVFKPSSALSYIATVLIFTEIYGVEVSVSWFITLFVSVFFLSIATPPIPGGAMTTYVIMFLQFGIPQDALAIALACDALFDFLATGMDQFLMPIILMNSVSRIGLVDRAKLEKD